MNQIPQIDSSVLVDPKSEKLGAPALDRLFREARTHNVFLDEPVARHLVVEAVELAKMGPTAANSSPMRLVFVESEAAKARLRPALAEGNIEKTMAAPVTAVVGHDTAFYEWLPRLFPHTDARAWFVGNEALIESTASQNGALQAAYLILALRAVGLDAGPMGGFDRQAVDETFFADTAVRSNMLINIGYGDSSKLFDRSPRPAFGEIAKFA